MADYQHERTFDLIFFKLWCATNYFTLHYMTKYSIFHYVL